MDKIQMLLRTMCEVEGDVLYYYCKGHVTDDVFLRLLAQENNTICDLAKIERIYLRYVPVRIPDLDVEGLYYDEYHKKRGNTPITKIDKEHIEWLPDEEENESKD